MTTIDAYWSGWLAQTIANALHDMARGTGDPERHLRKNLNEYIDHLPPGEPLRTQLLDKMRPPRPVSVSDDRDGYALSDPKLYMLDNPGPWR
jgi:hypothetical protein